MTGTPLEAVAEAIADNLASQSEVADVPDRYVDWIDPDELAAAAVDALQLTEEVGFQHRFPNGRSVLLEDADVKVARVLAATTGSEITEVSRLVSPWVVQPERNQP